MTPSRPRPLAAALVPALLCLAPLAGASAQGQVDFEGLGQAFLKLHCGRKAEAGSCTLDQVLAQDFVHARLGVFDVWAPAKPLTDKQLAEDFRNAAQGLLDLQRHLASWQDLEPELEQAVDEDIGKLRDWVGSWTVPSLSRVGRSEDRDLLTALGATEVVRAASERLQATTAGENARVLNPQFVDGIGIVLCPTRRDFMEMLGFVGLDDPAWRAQHWIEGADQWTQAWTGTRLILAMEYAPWSGNDPAFHTSLPPSRLDDDGVRQHILNQAARALVFRVLNRGDLDHLDRALAANLVIETAGRIAVLDGEGQIRTTGGQTAPYERFIPGGLSEGGVLPAIPAAPLDTFAACRWRDGKGTDWYLAALKEGQKDGAKDAAKDRKNPKAKDKRAHFELAGDNGQSTWVVTAPFMGPFAKEQPYPPPDYLNDYREFYKAYQAAFWHWMRTEAVDGSPEESSRKLIQLVRELGRPNEDGQALMEPFDAVVERVYGVPISGRDGGTDSLEWRFLDWLSKRKK